MHESYGLLNLASRDELSEELEEVESAAKILLEYLRAPNQPLTTDFPVFQLQEIAQSLSKLSLGTAEGCRVPLEYARLRLPAIRRDHIGKESDATNIPHSRGFGVDRPLSELIISVTTALDAYSRFSGVETDERSFKERQVSAKSTSGIRDAIETSEDLSKKFGEVIPETRRLLGSRENDNKNLVRQLHDADILNSLARAELREKIVVRWFRKTVDTLKLTPNKIRMAARAINLTADAALIWEKFNGKIFQATIEFLSDVSVKLEAEADKLEGKISGEIESTEDFDLQAITESLRRGETIQKKFVPMITSIEIKEMHLANLNNFSNLINLQNLSVSGAFTDISGLGKLTNLRKLKIGFVTGLDVSPLGNLRKLNELTLNGNISDVSFLRKMQVLQKLQMSAAKPITWAPLRDLNTLTEITIKSSERFDCEHISHFGDLEILSVWNAQLENIASLRHLRGLRYLSLRRCRGIFAGDLLHIGSLKSLNVKGAEINDPEFLEPLAARGVVIGGTETRNRGRYTKKS